MLTHEEAVEWSGVVEKIGKFVARDFPGIEWEDLTQDIWVHLLEREQKGPLPSPDADGVMRALKREAERIAWRRRKEDLRSTSQYDYRPSDVRRILETSFNYMDWPRGPVPDDAKSDDGLAAFDIRSDISAGLDRLSQSHRNAILGRYRDGNMSTGDAQKKMLYRAVDALTDILNTYRGRLNRRAVSNARAGHIVRQSEEG